MIIYKNKQRLLPWMEKVNLTRRNKSSSELTANPELVLCHFCKIFNYNYIIETYDISLESHHLIKILNELRFCPYDNQIIRR